MASLGRLEPWNRFRVPAKASASSDCATRSRVHDRITIAQTTRRSLCVIPRGFTCLKFYRPISRECCTVGELQIPALKPSCFSFLISFLVDARGGAMRGCRHSGVRIIIPPRKASQPIRVTCRYLRKVRIQLGFRQKFEKSPHFPGQASTSTTTQRRRGAGVANS